MSINEAVKEAIQKNLSSTVAGELSDYIKIAEGWKADLAVVKKEKEALFAQKSSAEFEVAKLKEKLAQHAAIDQRESAVTQREIKQEVFEANLKVTEAEKRASGVYQLADIVFRNPRLTYLESGNQPVSGGANPNAYPTAVSYSKTTTVEEGK